MAMKYDVISADCHIDLIWLPPDLFTSNTSAALKDRMPYVADGERGKEWVTKKGASFGLMNGMGPAGRLYEPGRHDAVMGPLVEPHVGRRRGERAAGAFPYDRQRRAARLYQAAAESGAGRPRLRHHQLPDVYVGGAVVGDLLGRARTSPRHQ